MRFVLVLLALGAGGWLVYAQVYETGGDRAVAWRDLTTHVGPLRFAKPTKQVFTSRRSLSEYLDKLLPGAAPRAPAIDFGRREAVLVAVGPRSSTGYALRIVRVTERRGSIVVAAREQTPSLGDPVRARLTYPYRLITLPKIDRPVRLELQGRP
jgi:hypothetical protein